MAIISSKKLRDALRKAQNVGRAEEPVTIDGCSFVLQSLPQEAYEQILQETSGLEEAEYIHAYQSGHLARAIVEIEGVDLRNVQFVEDDVPDGTYLVNGLAENEEQADKAIEVLAEIGIKATVSPPEEGATRTVLLERHEWIRQRLATWSREAITLGWKKFAEVVAAGEDRAREGIQFRIPDERAEDKFRRLLLELKDLEAEIPPDLVRRVLDEAGFLQKSSTKELEEVDRRLLNVAKDQEARESQAAAATQESEKILSEDLQERMRTRTPLNKMAMKAPAPPVLPQAPAPVPATAPPQIREALNRPRSKEIEDLEGQVDPSLIQSIEQERIQRPAEIPEITKKVDRLDPKGMTSILEKPPTAGINPRFQRPNRP